MAPLVISSLLHSLSTTDHRPLIGYFLLGFIFLFFALVLCAQHDDDDYGGAKNRSGSSSKGSKKGMGQRSTLKVSSQASSFHQQQMRVSSEKQAGSRPAHSMLNKLSGGGGCNKVNSRRNTNNTDGGEAQEKSTNSDKNDLVSIMKVLTKTKVKSISLYMGNKLANPQTKR